MKWKTLSTVILISMLNGCGSDTDSVEDTETSPSANNLVDDPAEEPDLDEQSTEPNQTAVGNSSDAYLQFNDSPYANLDFSGGYFYLEDFEDGVLEFPGARADRGNFATVNFGPGHHDSVDADDGLIDGDSLNGESWFYKSARTGVTWTFDAMELDNQLPTHVGIVWTDGRGEVTFEAFDAAGNSVSVQTGSHADESFSGGTAEDRFYGVVHASGISAIHLSCDNHNGIEMDHLQWGYQPAQ